MEEFVSLAERLADVARPITRRYFRTRLVAEFKEDDSPVTIADREIEAAIRQILEQDVPDHGILGEELGSVRMDAEYVWVIDPIDGTQAFATGKPLFGTLIALTRNGSPVLGILDQAFTDERWIGVEGRKTILNGNPIETRPCDSVDKAWLTATSPHMFEGQNWDAYSRVQQKARRSVYGAECYAYGLLAMGLLDLVVEADMKPYDFCALVPIVQGAGGVITDWEGAPLTITSGDRVLAAGDKAVHAKAQSILVG